jgi:MraZ protein
VLFTGEYEHTIDAKQRMAIPAEFRSRMDPEVLGSAFYLSPGPNGVLWLWPEKTFEQLAASKEPSLLPSEEEMEFEQWLFSQSRRLELDKTGRVRLPEHVIAEAGLGQQVVVLGVKDHLELHDPQQWKAQRKQKFAKQSEIMLRARRAISQGHGTSGGPTP